MMNIWSALIAMSGAYLVGSVPVGPLIAWLLGVSDLLKRGSGNSGATNVARVLGIKYFFLVLALDAGKAFLYLKILYFLGCSQGVIIVGALALMIGNSYSILLDWRGGKGVATALGVLSCVAPHVVLSLGAIWLVFLGLLRRVGMASIAAAMSLIAIAIYQIFVLHDYVLSSLMGALGMQVMWRHKTNLVQFYRG